MLNVLAVDDTEFTRQLMNLIITDLGHCCITANNGQEALNIAINNPIDLIFMDVSMPVMDGYESCKKIKDHYSEKLIPIIFVTALDDDENMEMCIMVGGDDFIVKPINKKVLESKIFAHQRILELFNQLESANDSLDISKKLVDREHNIVERIFSNNTSRVDDGFKNINYHTSPMLMFNGDLILVTSSPSGGIYTLIGDFTGHGLAAAIGCLPVSDIFFSMAEKHSSVGDIASAMNKSLLKLLPTNMFCCAAIIEINGKGDRLSLWLGGMNDLFLVNEGGGINRKIHSRCMPLGILSADEFEDTVDVIVPSEGQSLYAFTDGIIEAVNEENELFGEERLEATMNSKVENRIDHVLQVLSKFQGGQHQTDDVSLVEIKCGKVKRQFPNTEKTMAVNIDKKQRILPWSIQLLLTPDDLRETDCLSQLISLVCSIEGAYGCKDILATVITELFTNCLEHGILLLESIEKMTNDGQLDYYKKRQERLGELQSGEIRFYAKIDEHDKRKIEMTFTDNGPGFNTNKDTSLSGYQKYHGRGIELVSSLCEKMTYSDGGRSVSVIYILHQ